MRSHMFSWLTRWFKPKPAPIDPALTFRENMILHDMVARAAASWEQLELPLPHDCQCDGCLHEARKLLDGTCGVGDCVICDPEPRNWNDEGVDY